MPPLLVPIGVVAPNGVGGNAATCPSEGVMEVVRRIMRSLHETLLSRVEPGHIIRQLYATGRNGAFNSGGRGGSGTGGGGGGSRYVR